MKPTAIPNKIDEAARDTAPVRTGFDRMAYMHSYRQRPSSDPCRFDVLSSDRCLHAAAIATVSAKLASQTSLVVTPLRSGGRTDDR